ncbi:ficolin-2-like isoform X1 [Culex pipiens pallens]|uniref:ficolin-2-like isoform X1 n=1 Tax=Culex pipiens pallens TaxID=42434 RepID=UPI0022AA3D7A|nr:ficolin-2-like isoform X1 [Culex pipiens pallens]
MVKFKKLVLLVSSIFVLLYLINGESCDRQMVEQIEMMDKQMAMLTENMKNVVWSVMAMEVTFNRFKREMQNLNTGNGFGSSGGMPNNGLMSDCQKPNLDVLLTQYIKDRAVVEVKFSDGSSVTSNGSQIPPMMEQPPSQGDQIKSCKEANKTGPHMLKIDGIDDEFLVLCDNDYEGGGWLVIQNRFKGLLDFYRNWTDYKAGFGDINEDFWIGNELIHQISKEKPREIHFLLSDWEDKFGVAKYSGFQMGGEAEMYALKSLGSYSGTAGDSLLRNVGQKFSTKDRDNDAYEGSCSHLYFGGWWYDKCHLANLNGKYVKGAVSDYATMMCWSSFRGFNYGLKTSRIMVRY